MRWYVIIKIKVLLCKVKVTVRVQRSNHISDLIQNFLSEFHQTSHKGKT